MKTPVTNENILFLLEDKRNCKSHNMQEYFKTGNNWLWHQSVIRCEGELYFAFMEDYPRFWTGVRVREVACYGKKAQGGEYMNLRNKPVEDVTEWFWNAYRERGMVSIFEIWHIKIPRQTTHAEAHTI